jgi:hypothetical protein
MRVNIFPGKDRRCHQTSRWQTQVTILRNHRATIEAQDTPEAVAQSFDLVVMDGALRLRGGPLRALAFQAEHRGAKILPACETVFSREHQLRVAQR